MALLRAHSSQRPAGGRAAFDQEASILAGEGGSNARTIPSRPLVRQAGHPSAPTPKSWRRGLSKPLRPLRGRRAGWYSEAVADPGQSDSRPGVPRLPYVWDYDIDEEFFRAMLGGREAVGRLDRDWAAARLIEYASWREIRRLLGLGDLVRGWPAWRRRIRSESRRRGLDFLVEWLPRHHPELL